MHMEKTPSNDSSMEKRGFCTNQSKSTKAGHGSRDRYLETMCRTPEFPWQLALLPWQHRPKMEHYMQAI